MLTGSRLYYKTIKCEKNFCLLFGYNVQPRRCITQRTDNFEYAQMTSNPAFTERNIQKANAYLLHHILVQSKNLSSGITLYRACTYVYRCICHFVYRRPFFFFGPVSKDVRPGNWVSFILNVLQILITLKPSKL